jgi:polar amino acid transport system substrate-binding protein
VRTLPAWALVLSLVLALIGSAAGATEAAALPPDIARIIGRGELRVAMYKDDVPPFFMRGADSRLDGLDVALARDIAARLGVEVRFLRDADTFDGLVDRVAQGEADVVISLLSRTLPRALRVRFSHPYTQLYQALLINRLRTARLHLKPDPATALNRPDVRIGAVAGSSYVGFAREGFPEAELVRYDDWDQAVERLLAGDVHALLYDNLEVLDWLKRNPQRSLEVKAAILKKRKDHIAMAVNWRDTHWLAWLNLYLDTLVRSGAMERLERAYLQEETWRHPP